VLQLGEKVHAPKRSLDHLDQRRRQLAVLEVDLARANTGSGLPDELRGLHLALFGHLANRVPLRVGEPDRVLNARLAHRNPH